MTITPTTLSRAAGVAAVVAGLLFIGVQINHPPMELASVDTAEWTVRNTIKVLMAVCALAGITGMYLHQVRKNGVLGLIGYLVFGAGYLLIMGVALVAAYVLPSLTVIAPDYVNGVLAAASGGEVTSDIGLMQAVLQAEGIGFLAGGLIFGIALFRANVLARWAAALLALGSIATAAIPVLPQAAERLFALPNGIAMVGLGFSLWRAAHTADGVETEVAHLATAVTR